MRTDFHNYTKQTVEYINFFSPNFLKKVEDAIMVQAYSKKSSRCFWPKGCDQQRAPVNVSAVCLETEEGEKRTVKSPP
jgi:hypothetical protein